ncbi:MAG: ferredoxin family protein, partial [Coriobacteriaceae bacterium]|nr:ferredoxin family protein [Coriobacteriaceae bacterium]
GLYKISEDDSLSFDHAGCLECGTCRVLCGETVLAKWEFPQGSFGIEYRYG